MQTHLDEAGLKAFQAALTGCRGYLEYGCGGSTLLAARAPGVREALSVENDKSWAGQVANRLVGTPGRTRILHCDLGPVGEWGFPADATRVAGYYRYMALPWRALEAEDWRPDLVLVDGRFRTASFLYSWLAADEGTIILFDDYFDRDYHAVVERFCPVAERHGRMALFRVGERRVDQTFAEEIARSSIDPR